MAEFADMLKGLLDDPSTVDKLKGMLGDLSAKSAPSETADIDPAMLMKITGALRRMKDSNGDSRTRLLTDLRPYVSPARARRLDDAVNILRLLWVMDFIKEERDDQ